MSEEQEQMELVGWENSGGKVYDLAKAREELGLVGPHMKAGDLVGETFDILSAKPFKSTYEGQDRLPFFCNCRALEDEEHFTTVLGGAQPTEVIQSYIDAGGDRPLRVTLRFVKGGAYKGYYVIE